MSGRPLASDTLASMPERLIDRLAMIAFGDRLGSSPDRLAAQLARFAFEPARGRSVRATALGMLGEVRREHLRATLAEYADDPVVRPMTAHLRLDAEGPG